MANSSIGKNCSWEPHIINFVKVLSKVIQIQNIIDVGANFGFHSIMLSKYVSNHVYAFEPQLQNFKLLFLI